MSAIRPLREADLPTVAALYAELDRRDPDRPAPGYVDFFRRVLLESPLADPEIPSLVYDDPKAGVVGVIGVHTRPFLFEDRSVRVACSGPLVVHPDHRTRGVGALLLRRFNSGPQDATFNDRMVDEVQKMWRLLGGTIDTATSIGWRRTLAPLGAAYCRVAHRFGRQRLPGGTVIAALRSGRRIQPPAGTTEDLDGGRFAELLERLRGDFPLRPAYDDTFLSALFGAMDSVVLGERVAMTVRDADGQIIGAFVMFVAPGGFAEVLTVTASERNAGLVLDHLFREAIERRAVEVRGRVEPHLLQHLRDRRCQMSGDYWTLIQSEDAELVNAVLSGRALLNRFDGEWWMRPTAD
jgi:GNAT superfamily N-acetyltransferase